MFKFPVQDSDFTGKFFFCYATTQLARQVQQERSGGVQ